MNGSTTLCAITTLSQLSRARPALRSLYAQHATTPAKQGPCGSCPNFSSSSSSRTQHNSSCAQHHPHTLTRCHNAAAGRTDPSSRTQHRCSPACAPARHHPQALTSCHSAAAGSNGPSSSSRTQHQRSPACTTAQNHPHTLTSCHSAAAGSTGPSSSSSGGTSLSSARPQPLIRKDGLPLAQPHQA